MPKINGGEKIIYGKSGNGRDLNAYKIGNGNNVLVVTFAVHGFEDAWNGDGIELVKIGSALISSLSSSGTGSWTVYVVPAANPDGIIDGYTNNGPGRCTVKTKVDMNRAFPSGFQSFVESRNFTGAEQVRATTEVSELQNNIRKWLNNSGQKVVVDIHGWLNTTYGNNEIAKYFTDAVGISYSGNSGGGYLATWANSIGAKGTLVELPMPSSSSDIANRNFAGKVINAVKNIVKTGSPNTSSYLYKVGAQGDDIKVLQAFLKDSGKYNNVIDGIFGSVTEAAVKAWQNAYNSSNATKIVVDGTVGRETWGAMGFQVNDSDGKVSTTSDKYKLYLGKANGTVDPVKPDNSEASKTELRKKRIIALVNSKSKYNLSTNLSYDVVLNTFFSWYNEYSQGAGKGTRNLKATYTYLSDEYKQKLLIHWLEVLEVGNYLDYNLLTDEYYNNIANLPKADGSIAINAENKYNSKAAKDYYIRYYFPIDAFNINTLLDVSGVQDVKFRTWARFTYGSNQAEKREELALGVTVGILENTVFGVPVTMVVITNGVYEAIKSFSKEKIIAFSQFIALATINPEYKNALIGMITSTRASLPGALKSEYDKADSFGKGKIIGETIGIAIDIVGASAGSIKEAVKAGKVAQITKGAGNLKFKLGFDKHLIEVEDIVWKKGKGVVGGHNLDHFENAFKSNGWDLNEYIISKQPHPTVDGVYQIEYKLPAKDAAQNYVEGQYKKVATPKTVYDPSKISDSQIIEWGKEAMETGVTNGRVRVGVASNGLKFTGYIDEVTGEITNFHPSF